VSQASDQLVRELVEAGIEGVVTELRFHPVRRWRFDLAVPARKIACEVDGGVFSGGRHTTGAGYTRDCEKINTATLMGWTVYRFTTGMVKDGTAKRVMLEALAQRERAA
jgi:very-short-patch-repair endonuclease